jgi:hypothetical protein
VVLAASAGCGGGNGGTTDAFEGTPLEDRPVYDAQFGGYTAALADLLKDCGVDDVDQIVRQLSDGGGAPSPIDYWEPNGTQLRITARVQLSPEDQLYGEVACQSS